jgi:putative transposase
LPAKVAQQVLILLDKNWTSFFAAIKEYAIHPENFLGRPALPKYKDKTEGRNILVYTEQAVSTRQLKKGLVVPSGLPIAIQTKQKTVKQVRIVPRKAYYVVEVVYIAKEQKADVDPTLVASIDLGLDNLAALTSNKPGFVPLLVNGRPLKSINQFYNKRKAELQSKLPGKRETSPLIQRITNNRTRRIEHYMHTTSRRLVNHLINHRIGTLVVGRNPEWKQEINIGKRNNQAFVQIPHARFFQMLKYKCELVGIVFLEQEEAYTSKTSFLDLEPIHKHETYLGRRIHRGMFRSANKTKINADVNGSYNILRKAFPAAFAQGIEGTVVRPSPLGCK